MEQNKNRVGNINIIAMLLVALIFDGIEFLLGLSVVGIVFVFLVVLIKWIMFWTWFMISGVNIYDFSNKNALKRGLVSVFTPVIGLIPFIGSFVPEMFIGIAAINVLVRLEDKTGISLKKKDNRLESRDKIRKRIFKNETAIVNV